MHKLCIRIHGDAGKSVMPQNIFIISKFPWTVTVRFSAVLERSAVIFSLRSRRSDTQMPQKQPRQTIQLIGEHKSKLPQRTSENMCWSMIIYPCGMFWRAKKSKKLHYQGAMPPQNNDAAKWVEAPATRLWKTDNICERNQTSRRGLSYTTDHENERLEKT